MPLDPDLLPHVNLTDGTSEISPGLFRRGGPLPWPAVLQGPRYAAERQAIDELAPLAVHQACSGPVAETTLRGLAAAVNSLRDKVEAGVMTLAAREYIQARRHVIELQANLKALQDPNVARMVNGQWSARGNSVEEMVEHLTGKGLKFAPVAAGDQAYYTALYRALSRYEAALAQAAVGGYPGLAAR